MRTSRLLVKTLREVPTGAELPSHVYLLRGGYVKQLAAGLYSILPLGKRVLNKLERIIREEMEGVGGQEIDLPLVHPAELWKQAGRYQRIGGELVRFQDRGKQDMVLAMTHEEAVTDLLRHAVSSYKQLPVLVYQFKLKFRDEPRSRGGLIRVREFVMKDAYSFHASEADLDRTYEDLYAAYLRIFRRVGIEPVVVRSDPGIMGGKVAHEFMLEAESGEDYLILAEDGSYAANQEIAVFDREDRPEDPLPLKKVETPGKSSIEEVGAFLGVPAQKTMKAVLYTARDIPLVMVLLRGDLQVSEAKVRNHLNVSELIPAGDAMLSKHGVVAGYAGPVRHPDEKGMGRPWGDGVRILVDESVAQGNNFVSGANEAGHHFLNTNLGINFYSPDVGDFARAESGHKCRESAARLRAVRGIEIGNIFKLGSKFSTAMGANVLDAGGRERPMVMGCYGIGLGRLMAAVVEHSHDALGPIWPRAIAPYQVEVVAIGPDAGVAAACEKLAGELETAGREVLYDDRDERPGVKFKDADLWGVPVRIGISVKTLAAGECEWKLRGEGELRRLPLGDVAAAVAKYYAAKG